MGLVGNSAVEAPLYNFRTNLANILVMYRRYMCLQRTYIELREVFAFGTRPTELIRVPTDNDIQTNLKEACGTVST